MTVAIDNISVSEQGCIPVKLHLQKQMAQSVNFWSRLESIHFGSGFIGYRLDLGSVGKRGDFKVDFSASG